MTRPYVALTPAQEDVLTDLDNAAWIYAYDDVMAAHRAGWEWVTDDIMSLFTGLAGPYRATVRRRALELGLLVGQGNSYANHEVTP